jgi:hypothetical protein
MLCSCGRGGGAVFGPGGYRFISDCAQTRRVSGVDSVGAHGRAAAHGHRGAGPDERYGATSIDFGGKGRTYVRHPVWVAAVQDPCILGFDFLKATGCRFDLDGGTVSFRGGPVIALLPTGSGSGPPLGPISPAVCAVEPEVSDPLPVASVTFPMTYVPQAAQAQSRRLGVAADREGDMAKEPGGAGRPAAGAVVAVAARVPGQFCYEGG